MGFNFHLKEFEMQENRYASSVTGQSFSIDAGLRSYMLGVYNHMTTALALTGFAAFGTKLMVQANPAFGQLLFGTPLMYVIMFAPLAMVMWISFKINSMSPERLGHYSTSMPQSWVCLCPPFCLHLQGPASPE